mmetsp:Transcript_13039/g.39169  ORF Transcript_13039/g.39169 Transcript_13039/m.39169 type:complete len:242 (-) Transcript_13039:1408-2133(-)
MSAREFPKTCSCEFSSLSCFSTAVIFCLFSLVSLRRPCSAWSLSRSTEKASFALVWCPLSSSSSASMLLMKPCSFWSSSSTSAWSLGASSSGLRLACSCSVCSSIDASAFTFRKRRASSSDLSCTASCSRRHSRSTFRTSSTPMAALSLAKCPATASPSCASMPCSSFRNRSSSWPKRTASGLSAPSADSAACNSSCFWRSCSWHHFKCELLSQALASILRTSFLSVAKSAPPLYSNAWIS